jgi:hypothetical protein
VAFQFHIPPVVRGERYEAEREGGQVTDWKSGRFADWAYVEVTSNLDGDDDTWYYWFRDGIFQTRTRRRTFAIPLLSGVDADIKCIPLRNALSHWDGSKADYVYDGAQRIIEFIRPSTGEVDSYRIEYGTGDTEPVEWTTLGTIQDTGKWSYRIKTHRLDDLTRYWFRIVPVLHGNDGTPLVLSSVQVVRRPDAVSYTASISDVNQRVTFAEAS